MDFGDLLVEGVLSPSQVLLRVRDEDPVGEREARAAGDPDSPEESAGGGSLVESGFLEDLIVGHGSGHPMQMSVKTPLGSTTPWTVMEFEVFWFRSVCLLLK